MGWWSSVTGLFGRREPVAAATTPERAFVELALKTLREHPHVLEAESLAGAGLPVQVRLRSGEEQTLFLRNTLAETREAAPQEKLDRITRLLSLIDHPPQDRSWSEAMTALVPLLRVSTFAQNQGFGAEPPSLRTLLVSRSFAPGLRLFLGEDREATISFVTHVALTKWGQDADAALSVAFANLQRHVDSGIDAEIYDADASYPIWTVTRDDSYESSRLALPAYLASFRDKVQGNPIAIAPHRSLLVVSGDGSDRAIVRLCAMAEAEFNASPRSISPALYTVNQAGEIVPFHLPTEHALHTTVERGHYLLQASCYAEQKDELVQRFEKKGVDVFVATFSLFEDDQKALASRAAMSQSVETLLPTVDLVALVTVVDGKVSGQSFMVPWNQLMRLAPECFEPAPEYDPPRVRIVNWPSDATLNELERYAQPVPQRG